MGDCKCCAIVLILIYEKKLPLIIYKARMGSLARTTCTSSYHHTLEESSGIVGVASNLHGGLRNLGLGATHLQTILTAGRSLVTRRYTQLRRICHSGQLDYKHVHRMLCFLEICTCIHTYLYVYTDMYNRLLSAKARLADVEKALTRRALFCRTFKHPTCMGTPMRWLDPSWYNVFLLVGRHMCVYAHVI